MIWTKEQSADGFTRKDMLELLELQKQSVHIVELLLSQMVLAEFRQQLADSEQTGQGTLGINNN